MKNRLLIIIMLTLAPVRAFSLTPEDVAGFGDAAHFLLNTYARLLPYMPAGASQSLQADLGIYAYDPNGNSVYGNVKLTVGIGNTTIADSSLYVLSPYVFGAQGSCPGQSMGFDGLNENKTCYENPYTRGYQGSISGSVSCVQNAYNRSNDSQYNTTCSTLRLSCITGGYGKNWTQTCLQDSSWCSIHNCNFSCASIVSLGGKQDILWVIPNCGPSVPNGSELRWRDIPLPSDVLTGTAQMFKVFNNGVSDPDVFPADRADAQTALGILSNGVGVASSVIPQGTVEPPCTVWDCHDGTITGGGGGIVITTSIVMGSTITVNVNVSTAEIVGRLDTLIQISSSIANPDVEISTGKYWNQWLDFSNQYSTAPTGWFNSMIPNSTTTWTPCFNFASLWSVQFAGSKPPNASAQVCLTQFPNWDLVLALIKGISLLTVALWGSFTFWTLIRETRLPGVAGALELSVSALLVAASLVFAATVYIAMNAIFLYLTSTMLTAMGGIPHYVFEVATYFGITAALSLGMSILSAQWNFLLFMNFWGALRK